MIEDPRGGNSREGSVARKVDKPGIQVEEVQFSELLRDYTAASSLEARNQTQLHQLLHLYIDIFREWPWYETYTESDVLKKMSTELYDKTGRKPFLLVASQDKDVIGFAWGFQVSSRLLPHWLLHAEPFGDYGAYLPAAHVVASQYKGDQVTYVADMAVAPQVRGSNVISRLMGQMSVRQIMAGAPEYASWTIRKADEYSPGKSPRMHTLVEMLGGREAAILGLLPTNPSMRKVVMAGNFYDSARILTEHRDNVEGYFLSQMRARKGGERRV